MDRANTVKTVSARINPLIAGAVISVLVLGVIGVAAITGVIPGVLSEKPSGSLRTGAPPEPIRAAVQPSTCPLCGTVEAIRTVELRGGASGVGAGGGFTGAVVGNPIEREVGATTILGAAGETVAGNEINGNVKKRIAYRVTVRMDDGSYRTVSQSSPPTLAVGDKVRVVEGRLVRA